MRGFRDGWKERICVASAANEKQQCRGDLSARAGVYGGGEKDRGRGAVYSAEMEMGTSTGQEH